MITVTDVALEQIQGILQEEAEGTVIRVHVSPGCGGMKYRLALDESKAEYDKKIEVRGITFVMDPFAAALIEEITVDWNEFDDFVVKSTNGPESSC